MKLDTIEYNDKLISSQIHVCHDYLVPKAWPNETRVTLVSVPLYTRPNITFFISTSS